MRLYVSDASPFARKCRIVARERGLIGRVEEVVSMPLDDEPRLLAVNPIAQVPALELDDGTMLFNSPLIAAYLDGFNGKPRLVPPATAAAHWRVRRVEALADGVLEMAVKITLENRRPEGERSPFWIERWTRNLHRALDAAEAEVRPPLPLDLGLIALGCIGAYLDLRHSSLNWREGRPRLAAFSSEIERQDSFRATAPG
jgi:glutathione S-transferase